MATSDGEGRVIISTAVDTSGCICITGRREAREGPTRCVRDWVLLDVDDDNPSTDDAFERPGHRCRLRPMTTPSLPAAISQSLPPTPLAEVLAEFDHHHKLSVRQRRRWLEMLFNWEQKNSYAVYDEDGQHRLQVKEEGSGLVNILKRLFLRTQRPFSATVYDNPIPKPLLFLKRPFRFFFHRLEVAASSGEVLGAIERRWSWIRRIYSIADENGAEVATLFGPILRPWTFEIRVSGQPRGLLQKRWSGLSTEMFTDADNFVLDLHEVTDPKLKVLVFAATVLIDVVHFEQAKHG